MSIEYVAAAIHPQFQPPLMFACGLLASLLACTLSMLVDPNSRAQRLITTADTQTRSYRQLRDKLTLSARHVDFASDDAIDLRDDELQST